MAAVNWAATSTSLTTAIGGATGTDLTLLTDVRTRLTRAGTQYDALWAAVSGVDAAKTTFDADFSAALTAWWTAYEAAHTDADRAARYGESLEAAASGAYLARVGDVAIVLAPASAISWSADETPIASAYRHLLATATPALRVVAKEAGTPGNRIEVRIDDATSGATRYKIRVRLGSTYEEAYDEINPATPTAANAASNGGHLLAECKQLGTTRPDSTGAWLALTGGTGGSIAAAALRLQRAMQLPAAIAKVPAMQPYAAALTAAASGMPSRAAYNDGGAFAGRGRIGQRLIGAPTSVLDLEEQVLTIIAEATRLLAVASY